MILLNRLVSRWVLLGFILCPCFATNQTVLFKDLFGNYISGILPRCSVNTNALEVKVGIALRQVVELSERKQILTLNVWIRLSWFDCQLVWNSSDYGGVDNLVLLYEQIWTPDLTLYDNNEDQSGGMPGSKDSRATVRSDGTVSYNFPTVLKSLCKIDASYFPFDTQTCPLKFGSWSYHGFDINVVNRSISGDTSSFKHNTEWTLVSADVIRHELYYSCCPEPFPDVTFYVTLKRKPMSDVVNLLFPCMLITSIALLGFILPPDAGEKIGLQLTVLLALAFYALVVSESLPPSENVPYVGVYFAFSLLMVSVSTMLSVFVLNIHYKGQHGRSVPICLRKFVFGVLARIVLMHKETASIHPMNEAHNIQGGDNIEYCPVSSRTIVVNEAVSTPVLSWGPLVSVLKDQLDILKKFDKKFKDQASEDEINSEWQQVAMVMDRCFFVLFFIFSIICTSAIILQML